MRKPYLYFIAATMLVGIMGGAFAQAPTGTKQPYFAPKRVLLIPMTRSADKNKTLSPELEATVAQSLRNLFSAPQYRAITGKEAVNALLTAKKADSHEGIEPPTEPSPAEVTEALIRAGKKTEADIVVLAVVRDASSRQVTLALWHVDVKTARATIEGQTLRRSWSDYPLIKQTSDGGHSTTVTLPPMKTAD
ncbi:MAG: hypothetical protein H7145_08835, partial [Akkermansiaceae bacterium]|nr:hypothetical protein [Armatimonadota bacterium]